MPGHHLLSGRLPGELSDPVQSSLKLPATPCLPSPPPQSKLLHQGPRKWGKWGTGSQQPLHGAAQAPRPFTRHSMQRSPSCLPLT